MSRSNKGAGVDPRLQNVANALYLTTDDDVALRTGITGDIIIEGNVTIPGTITVESSPENPVHVHVTESSPIDLSASTLEALENINAVISDGGGSITVDGSVSISTLPEVEIKNDSGNPISVSKNSSINSPSNRIYVSQETDLTLADSTYELNVARGLVDSQYPVTRSALNPSVNQDIETSIWVEGGIYPHGNWTTAQPLFVVSDNAADVGQTVFIEGLDSNYVYQTDTVTLNGTTGVLSTKSFIRIYTGTIISASNNSANAGEIRFRLSSNSGIVVAHIRAGFGTTKLSQYTVPAGHTGYVLYGDATTFRGGSGNIGSQIRMMVRPFGGSFIVAFVAEVVNGFYRNDFAIPMKITEKSDIDIRVIADANNTVASCNYQLILIPNT